jgi:hypothetical protein
MEPDETDFDRLIFWLEAVIRSERGIGDIVRWGPRPLTRTARIIQFLPYKLRRDAATQTLPAEVG